LLAIGTGEIIAGPGWNTGRSAAKAAEDISATAETEISERNMRGASLCESLEINPGSGKRMYLIRNIERIVTTGYEPASEKSSKRRQFGLRRPAGAL